MTLISAEIFLILNTNVKTNQKVNYMQINLDRPHCVYITRHPTGLYYIGKGQPDKIIFKGYRGSGNKLNLRMGQPGYEIDTWSIKILATFDTESEAYRAEAKLVDLERLLDTNCLNDKIGGNGPNTFLSNLVNVL